MSTAAGEHQTTPTMLSARPLYNTDLEYYRYSDRGLSASIGQSASLATSSTHSSRRQSPVNEPECKTSGSQRKRVPVACERCRKRKIKCSGDEGAGRGCVNCRNAGWDGCQFLRVQSFNTHVNAAAVVSGRSWHLNNRYHPYSFPGHRAVNHNQAQPPYHLGLAPYSMWNTTADCGSFPASSQPAPWTRPSYASQYPLAYDGESNDPFSASAPPSYMLPDPEPAPHINLSYINALNRPQQHHMWLEQINSFPIAQHNRNTHSPYAVAVSDSQPQYGPMTASTNAMSAIERPLPTTGGARCLPAVSAPGNETPPMSAVSHRSSLGWQTETASTASVASSHTSCSGRPEPASSFSDQICAQSGLSYGYDNDSTTTHDTVPSSALPIAMNDSYVQQKASEGDSPVFIRLQYVNSSRDSPQSSTATDLSYNYSYNTANVKGRRLQITSRSPSNTLGDPCQWTAPSSAKNVLSDVCQQDAGGSEMHSHHASNLSSLNSSSSN